MTLECVSMNRIAYPLILTIFTLLLASCSHMPQMVWKWPDQKSPGQEASGSGSPATPTRKELVVPPSLRGQVSVPTPKDIASGQSPQVQKLEAKQAKMQVAGKYVALNTRVYNQSVADVFSSVVDAMTQLNMPVDSVDSPSGTITTGWIHQDANSPNLVTPVLSLFGGGPVYVRYRYVVRVMRLTTSSGVKTQLEIRTLGQSFKNSHWVNEPLKQKVSNDLFSAVEDQLTRKAQNSAAAANTPSSTTVPSGPTTPAATPTKSSGSNP